jgi:hypothetical protein
MTAGLLSFVALSAGLLLTAQDTEPAAAPSTSPYSEWRLGPPTDPEWFPIGVWLQEPSLADEYAALGINTFVGLWKGPTEEQLDTLAAAGMKVVCSLNKVAKGRLDDPHIIAWMQIDEPDNRGDGLGARATPSEVAEMYARLRKFDPDRPVWLNLGQGVANDSWKGRGARRSDYPGYVEATDIASFDVYPVTNIQKSDGENYLWYVAKGVRRLREWGKDTRVVWNFIECTGVGHATKKPTPHQVRALVWMSLVSGSRGLVYFCHEFEPKLSAAALLADPAMSRRVAAINREVLGYAPILNSATIAGAVSIETTDRIRVGAMLKEHGGAKYLFAVAMRNNATTATFTVEGVQSGRVEVLGEGRDLEVTDGTFTDAFAPYEVHIYRVEG